MTTSPFPWTAAMPQTCDKSGGGCGGAGGGGCGKINRAQLISIPDFGVDIPSRWGKISRTFGGRFAMIGPTSEWDCCILEGFATGPIVLSVGVPVILPMETDITVRPYRMFGTTNANAPAARLEVIVYDAIPPWAPHTRAPRIYPDSESDALSSVADTSIYLNTAIAPGGGVRRVAVNVCVAGAKSLSLYLRNTEASDIEWALAGSRHGDGTHLFYISPTTFGTYNTIAAGTTESYHLDVETDAFENIFMVARSTAAGTITLFTGVEVRG